MPDNAAKKREPRESESLWTNGGPSDPHDVFSKAEPFWNQSESVKQMGIYPLYQPLDRNDGPTAVIEGKSVIMAGSNNYLGLTIHPEVRKASADAAMEFGTSFTGSRLLNGTHRLHGLLEGQLADFFDKEDSLVFSTGYQVNLGVISALVDENSILFMDKGDHASIYDAARLARGKVVRFDHNDEKALEEAFKQADPALGGQPGLGKIVIVDGVFSMEGNLCRLPEILSVCKKYKARLIVDDAHGVGTVGPGGRGTSHYFGLEKEVDLIIGTFSKTLASIGGFVAGDAKIIHYIKHFGRSIIYSASLPAPNVAAVICALKIMRREPERVERVIANGRTMREGLKSIGLNIGISETPIVPIIIGDELLTLTLWRELLNMGVYVNVAIHPAVPRGKSLLRTSYTSEHTREHLDRVLDIFSSLKKKHNL